MTHLIPRTATGTPLDYVRVEPWEDVPTVRARLFELYAAWGVATVERA